MKKILLFLIIFICGCSNKLELSLETIVENNSNMAIAINYPLTNINKLDKFTLSYIKNVQEGFKSEYENDINISSELNIDYKYFKYDKYINIVLYTFINSSKLAHPINEIKTIVYDVELNKIIKLSDFMTQQQLESIVPKLKQNLILKYKDCIVMESLTSEVTPNFSKYNNFTISNFITFYYQPYEISSGYCNTIDVSIDISEIGIKLNEEQENETMKYIPIYKNIDPYSKVIAITFDDGPSKYTDEILEILKENNAYATFFVLGNKVGIYKDTINKAISYGNEIGNHSYNHKWLTRLSIEEFKNQINKTQDIIYENTNYIPTLLRPTYGSINNRIKNNTDLNIVLWNVDSMDWKLKNSEKIINRVINDIGDMDIVLFHDTYKSTKEAIEKLVPILKEKGYQCVTVSDLYEIKKIRNQY